MALHSNRVAKLTVILAATVAGVLAAELLLRYWVHPAPQLELDIYRFDGAGNLRLRADVRRRHVTRFWDVEVAINSEGWRDRPEPITRAGSTVLALGDSFAFGWGVRLAETFLFLVEEELNAEQPVRWVKAGVPGTGTGDQFALLESLWPKYRPRAVVVCFFVGNDFTDVQLGGTEQFEVEDGLLVRRPLRDEPSSWVGGLHRKLGRHSHLLQLARAVHLNWSRSDTLGAAGQGSPRTWDEWLREFAQVHRKTYPERTQRGVEQTLGYLDRFEEFCRQKDAAFVLVVIPRSYQVYPRERTEMLGALGWNESDMDWDRPQRVLADWSAAKEVVLVDLLPSFRHHRETHPQQSLYYYPDAHLSPAGHRLAAEVIYRELAGVRTFGTPKSRDAGDAGIH